MVINFEDVILISNEFFAAKFSKVGQGYLVRRTRTIGYLASIVFAINKDIVAKIEDSKGQLFSVVLEGV